MEYSVLIKKLRTKMLLTQEEFGEEMGVTTVTVNRWENGVSEPTMKAKRKIIVLCKKNNLTFKTDNKD